MPRPAIDLTSTNDLPDALHRLLGRQDMLATRSQLLAAGVSKASIRWNSGRGWRVILPRVILLGSAMPTERQRILAALLWAGPTAYLSGASACAQYGLHPARRAADRVVMVAPAPTSSRRHGYAAVRRTLLDDVGMVERGALRYASAARAVVDAAVDMRSMPDRTALFVEAVQRRTTTVADLHQWICRLRTRDAAGLLTPLDAAASGAWSLPEYELLDLISGSAALPEPWLNPVLTGVAGETLVSPDAWLDDVGVAIMMHSREYHADGDDFVRTVDQDGALTEQGIIVIGVTPTGMRRDPAGVLRRIEATYAMARTRERPPVRAVPRTAPSVVS